MGINARIQSPTKLDVNLTLVFLWVSHCLFIGRVQMCMAGQANPWLENRKGHPGGVGSTGERTERKKLEKAIPEHWL